MRHVTVDGSFERWRSMARGLLHDGVPPEDVIWSHHRDTQAALDGLDRPAPRAVVPTAPAELLVSRRFVSLARMAACHRSPDRWRLLYRALWRHARGEPHLLSLVSDPDVHPLLAMARAVQRASHKMKAFVRFRTVGAGDDAAYVAWFEPPHPVPAADTEEPVHIAGAESGHPQEVMPVGAIDVDREPLAIT